MAQEAWLPDVKASSNVSSTPVAKKWPPRGDVNLLQRMLIFYSVLLAAVISKVPKKSHAGNDPTYWTTVADMR